jgi:anti-sigma B factor antagonist
MYPAAPGIVGLSVSSRAERGYVIAALSGELDIAAAPMLREKLLGLLGPGASRLIIDLSAVSYADARGLTVLVGTGRRARLLGGFLRLAGPSPEVARVLSIIGLSRHLEIFPTVHAAITSPLRSQRRHHGTADVRTNIATPGAAHAQPARAHTGQAWRAVDGGELRMAVAAVLTRPDAWRDADPAASSPPPCVPWPMPAPARPR